MGSSTWTLIVISLVGLALPGGAGADVIHLTNGHAIEVEAWRDAGDAIEFARGGGIIRISKIEIARIDGKTTRTDLRMYSAPVTAPASTAALDRPAAVKEMLDLLTQGEALFSQTVLLATEKAGALRRLGEKWTALSVPDGLREAHAEGQRALQVAAEAFTAEGAGTAPDTKERIVAARTGVQAALEQVKKASGEQG